MTPSEKIDQLIAGITDWRGKTFASVRKAILATDKEIVEEWKWMGSSVWERDGRATGKRIASRRPISGDLGRGERASGTGQARHAPRFGWLMFAPD